ncbi:MAG: tetratricopeptide repeat protein [Halioglobus sp.]
MTDRRASPRSAPGKESNARDSSQPDPEIPVRGEHSLVRGFWQELRQRKAFRVGATYVVVVWALLQSADVVFPILGLPDWIMTGIFLGALLGFPVVLLLAWTIQWGPGKPRFDRPFKFGGSRGYRSLYLLTTVVLTGLLSVLIYQSYEQVSSQEPDRKEPTVEPRDPNLIPRNSIAVLRFANISGNVEDDYFSDGLSEELLNLLAKLQELKVASRTSSWSLPEDLDVTAIRDRLRVGYVLEGSVRRSGEVLRVTAQLINTQDGYHVWSETFDRKMEDVFLVQDEVASKITGTLKILLSEKSRRFLERSQIENVEAYNAYLLGAEQLRMPLNLDVLAEAEQLFNQSKALEPGFSRAWAGLCKTYLGKYQFTKSSEDFGSAETSCHRTLTLDESSPGIFEALGDLYMASGQYDRAMESYESALVLAPKSVDGLMGLGNSLARQGETERAESYLQQAIQNDVGYWKAHNALGTFYFNQGRYEDAIPHYRRVTSLARGYAIGHNNLGAAYMLAGLFDEAVQEFSSSLDLRPHHNTYSNIGSAQFFLRNYEEAANMYQLAVDLAPEDGMQWGHLGDALSFDPQRQAESRDVYKKALSLVREQWEINPSDPYLIVAIARYHARLGDKASALKAINSLDESALDVYVYYDLSLAYVALGDQKSAMESLRQAIKGGYDVNMIARDPGFDSLHGIPEFQALVASGN